ncbi:MAG: C-24(28) sterol reductase [Sporothrix thermara]
MSSRYSLRQTPRKKELFEGMVETPSTRNRTRKPLLPVENSDAEGDSSSAAESTSKKTRPAAPRRRLPKFVEHIDETDEASDSQNATEQQQHSNGKQLTDKISDFTSSPDVKPNMASPLPSGRPAAINGKATDAEPIIKTEHAVDGWKPGADYRIDYSGHKEFGGSLGVSAMMIGFPMLMWYMWIGATYYGGKLPLPTENQTMEQFARHLLDLVYTGAFPSLKAWTIYWTFLIFEGCCYCLMPGIWGYGKPLLHLNGKQLPYYCSAYTSFYATIALAFGLHISGLFPLYTLIDEFGPLLSVAIISGFLVSIVAYVSALVRGAQHRMTGAPLYDFFMGAELNPRMFGILDFKMFFEVRLPWFILFLLSCGVAARQLERYGYVSGEIGFLIMAHYLYANACSKGEELIITTWDMYYEKWGFMLIFWNLAGVPLSYCHCTLYLANHEPSEYQWSKPALIALYAMYLFVYWVWDTCNSQKNRFRSAERGTLVIRHTFPQLPWQTIKNPKTIKTSTGDDILADGWYGMARKLHYSCDAFFAISWGLICGFKSPFPWFYPVFFCLMISHRALRDIQRCRLKYGEAWTEYEKRVPYLFIPYVI